MPKPTLNKADIELLQQIFATKGDLNLFATKDNIEDIIDRAVKRHVGNLPTKDEFYTRMDQLAGEYDKFSTDSPDIVAKQSELDDRLQVVEAKVALTSN